MFKQRKKQKSFSKEYELKGGKEGGFILRVTDQRVDLETKDKSWKMVFSNQTYEYGFVFHMLKNESFKELHAIAVALFVTRLVCRDAAMVPEIYALADRVQERLVAAALAAKPEQSDEEILAEEKVLHEQTPESIAELEEIKNRPAEDAVQNTNDDNG